MRSLAVDDNFRGQGIGAISSRINQFDPLGQHFVGDDRAPNGAVDDNVRYLDLAVDLGLLADHQRARVAIVGGNAAFDVAVDAQSATENDVAADDGPGRDQPVDTLLRLDFLFPKHWGTSPITQDHTRTEALARFVRGMILDRDQRARRAPDCLPVSATRR